MSETPTHFIAVCPHCLVGLKVPSEYSGQNVRCKHCDQKFRALSPDFPLTPGSSDYSAAAVSVPGSGSDRLAVNCPNCGTGLSVRRAYAGQHVRCGQCGQKFPVSLPGDAGASVESDLFSQLYSTLAEPRSGEASTPPIGRGGVSEEQLAAISGERDQLRDELEAPASGPKDIRRENASRAGPSKSA